jgi:hypothetical protein
VYFFLISIRYLKVNLIFFIRFLIISKREFSYILESLGSLS